MKNKYTHMEASGVVGGLTFHTFLDFPAPTGADLALVPIAAGSAESPKGENPMGKRLLSTPVLTLFLPLVPSPLLLLTILL